MSMKKFAKFATDATAVNLLDSDKQGVFNGYQILQVLHGGEWLDFSDSTYYYIPKLRRVVTYRGSRAKTMARTKGKLNFQWKYQVKTNRKNLENLHKNIMIDSESMYAAGAETFN